MKPLPTLAAGLVAFALAACQRQEPPQAPEAPKAPAAPAAPAASASPETPIDAFPPVEPPAPGTPGGLPDDRTPVAEGPFTPESAQGAADVVQTYYALIGERKYNEAWRLWRDRGRGSGHTEGDFVTSFGKYASYNAQVGGPSQIEGAAGSSYVTVPVVIYGRLRTGEEVHEKGTVTLRRVNDVPGSTADQRRWGIEKIDLAPSPK